MERPTLVGLSPAELTAIETAMLVVSDVARLTKRSELEQTWLTLSEMLERARKMEGQRQWEYFRSVLGEA